MKLLLSAFILFFLMVVQVFTQCGCMSSMASGLLSPATSPQAGTLREGFALINLAANYTTGNKEYSSVNIVPNTTVREFWNSTINFNVSYGINKRLTTTVGVNYVLKSNIETFSFNYKSNGWNSVQIGAKYNIIYNPKENYELTLIGDLFLPLQAVNDTTYLYLQPSSGATGFTSGLFYHKGFQNLEIDLFSSFYSTYWSENAANYKFGTLNSLSIALIKPILKQLALGLNINLTYKDKDKLNGEVQTNSGFKNIALSPQIYFNFDEFSIGLNSDIPIYNNFFGSQISKNFSAGMYLQYLFNTN